MPIRIEKETQWFTVEEVAGIVGKSLNTVRNHIHSGILSAKYLNKGFLVERSTLEEYVTDYYKLPSEIIDLKTKSVKNYKSSKTSEGVL